MSFILILCLYDVCYWKPVVVMELCISCISDISATTFYKAQPVIDFAVEYLNVRDTSKRLSDQERIKV